MYRSIWPNSLRAADQGASKSMAQNTLSILLSKGVDY